MRKWELEKTLRAASRVAQEAEFFLIGSQAVHAYCRRPPAEVLLSQECDIYPKNRPETASLIHSRLGRRSSFARRNGYHADIVTPQLAALPVGWERRLKRIKLSSVTAFCLEAHDLAVSKLAAGRLKDLEFVGALFRMRLANPQVVRRRIGQLPGPVDRRRIRVRLQSVLDDRDA